MKPETMPKAAMSLIPMGRVSWAIMEHAPVTVLQA
jgi:hypothetical protein